MYIYIQIRVGMVVNGTARGRTPYPNGIGGPVARTRSAAAAMEIGRSPVSFRFIFRSSFTVLGRCVSRQSPVAVERCRHNHSRLNTVAVGVPAQTRPAHHTHLTPSSYGRAKYRNDTGAARYGQATGGRGRSSRHAVGGQHQHEDGISHSRGVRIRTAAGEKKKISFICTNA